MERKTINLDKDYNQIKAESDVIGSLFALIHIAENTQGDADFRAFAMSLKSAKQAYIERLNTRLCK